MADEKIDAARGQHNTIDVSGHVYARILWPALGFPAVVDPNDGDSDGVNCIHILFLTREKLHRARYIVARHLRYVPWSQRHMRYLDPKDDNSFPAEEIKVSWAKKPKKGIEDKHSIPVCFANDSIMTNLSRYVLDFYENIPEELGGPLKYLYEARISSEACKKIVEGQYNLFWVNRNKKDTVNEISEEMRLLLENFAKPGRKKLMERLHDKLLSSQPGGQYTDWDKIKDFLFKEYEFDYGALHPPYNKKKPITDSSLHMREQPENWEVRTEVLHPLFIKSSASNIKIGHITDLHFGVRHDVYENQWNRSKENDRVLFNNWNKSAASIYQQSKSKSDILLLTGDLIDYGRGHIGIGQNLGIDEYYHDDRNWFLFYDFIASGKAYTKPVYTILGNHDWRINPYPPFAIAGAPSPKAFVHNATIFTDKELKEVLKKAHGPGHKTRISYDDEAIDKLTRGLKPELLWEVFQKKSTIDLPGIPTETKVDSVAWYLLLINPFLDYAFQIPGGYHVLMLDWGEDEYVIFRGVAGGVEYLLSPSISGGPRASNCLSKLQQQMVKWFLNGKSNAKIIGIHSPVIAPWPHYTDDLLEKGQFTQMKPQKTSWGTKKSSRGTRREYTYSRDAKHNISNERLSYGHPIIAFPNSKDASKGNLADYGTIAHQNSREWLIRELRDFKVRGKNGMQPPASLVLSGHNHRNNLLVVEEPSMMNKEEWRVKSIDAKKVEAVRCFRPDGKRETQLCPPLYVNTTSAGPRGHAYPESQKKTSSLFVDNADNAAVASLYVDPGYAEIELGNDGIIKKVDFRRLEIKNPVFLRNALWSKSQSKPGRKVKLMVDVQTENLPANTKVRFEIWEIYRYSTEKDNFHHKIEITVAKNKTSSKKKAEELAKGLETMEVDWKIPPFKSTSGNNKISGKLPKDYGDPDMSDIRDGNPWSNLPPPPKPREFYFLAKLKGDQAKSPILYEDDS